MRSGEFISIEEAGRVLGMMVRELVDWFIDMAVWGRFPWKDAGRPPTLLEKRLPLEVFRDEVEAVR